MITVAKTTRVEWTKLKYIRLCALEADPTAFDISYNESFSKKDHFWQEWAGHEDDITATYLACDNDRPIGMMMCQHKETSLHIDGLWIDPSHREQGLARRLSLLAIKTARRNRIPTIHLWVTKGNQAALSLYHSLGFCSEDIHQTITHDVTFTAGRMVLSLLHDND